jgi:hypothetical protein
VACKKERRIRLREHQKQQDEEYRLREQWGLSPPATPENSSSKEEEEEESDRGRPPERWDPSPPSPRGAEAAEEQAPVVHAEAPAAGRSMEEAVRAAEASQSAAAAMTGATAAPAEPSRKRKRGFSTMR